MPPSPATSAPPLPRRRTLHGQFVQRLLWPLVLAFVLALCCFLWETIMATRILDFHMLTQARAAVRHMESEHRP